MIHLDRQRGATLVVGLIMLALIALTVVTAYTLSTTNLKSVGNMQFRNEAIAASNLALEQVLSSPFSEAPTEQEVSVDIDNDGNVDYVVRIMEPECIRGSLVPDTSGAGRQSSRVLRIPTAPGSYRTVWNLTATVTNVGTGAQVTVHQGVRQVLSEAQFNAVCA